MKGRVTTIMVVLLLSLIPSLVWAQSSDEGLDIRDPSMWFDKNGRFWVYRDGILPQKEDLEPQEGDLKLVPPYGIPYLPYAWMTQNDKTEKLREIIRMDPNHQQNPHEGEKCISVSIKWMGANWCGVGFVSGPDENRKYGPWWGKNHHGWYYDLSKLKKRKFVFHLRGENGGERVQWKVGFLGKEKFGDSLPFPAETKWLKLKTTWVRYELDLSEENLMRVCSLCFVVEKLWQEDPSALVTFYIDAAYFE